MMTDTRERFVYKRVETDTAWESASDSLVLNYMDVQ